MLSSLNAPAPARRSSPPEVRKLQALLVEFVGSALLVLVIVLSGARAAVPDPNSHAYVAIGLTLAGLIYAFDHVSGAHFNPAVTIMTLWNRGIATDSAVAYIVVQVAAGIAAVTTYNYLKKRGVF